ncbi:MAG TPA: Ku protein [Longimicrobiaceae bacterium]|nr:Ku protein [Longimicrobiaceae bacterium]
MSARSIGSATVSFGLVSVPVKLYSSGDSSSAVAFNWIHKDCGSRLKQQYICAREGVVVERDDMVKGYEFAKEQYVLFTADELKAFDAKSDDSIGIEEFVPADQVDKSYLDKVYYLGPDRGGDRAYKLLSTAMRQTGLSALGRYAARGKQYLVLLSPMGDGLVMEQLRYSHEIRPFSEVPLGNGDVKDAEVKLAVQFIEQVASDKFEPEKYKDEVRERVMELIDRKIAGEDITTAPTEAPQTQIIDLMAALRASIAKTEGDRKPAARKPAKRSEAQKDAPSVEKSSRTRKKAANG